MITRNTAWFYARDRQKQGPVSHEQLKQMLDKGALRPTDMVWREGAPRWLPLSQVFSDPRIVAGAPPAPSPPVSSTVRSMRLPGPHRRLLVIGVVILGVIGLGIAYAVNRQRGTPSPVVATQSAHPDSPQPRKEDLRDAISTQNASVVAEGVGATADEALKDAFRNAVRQVVGAVVDAETLVKNDEIISDKVLTYSDGFVKTYEEISKKQDKGLIRTKIKVVVERRSVIAKLKAANITVKDVDGQGIFAEVVTQLDAEKNAEKLIKKALEGFPLNVLQVEVVGQPEVVKKDAKRVTIRIKIRFAVDLKAYHSFSEKFQLVLDKISKEKGDFQLIGTDDMNEWKKNSRWYGGGVLSPTNTVRKRMPWWTIVPKSSDGATIALCLSTTKSADRMEWRYYMIDDSVGGLLTSVTHRKYLCEMRLYGVDRKVITSDRFEASHNGYGVQANLVTKPWSPPHKFYTISPVFLIQQSYSSDGYTLHFFMTREVSLSLDELKAVQRIECTIRQQ